MSNSRRFNPVFVLPVARPPETILSDSSPLSPRTGRKTGTGSAAVSLPTRKETPRSEILGFKEASLFEMVRFCGRTPLKPSECPERSIHALESLRLDASRRGRPLVVFPECTTSNGRGLLRFAGVFRNISVPVRDFEVYIMCVRLVFRGSR